MASNLLRIKEDIRNNLDVSIVMPFYKKMAEFRAVFPHNKAFLERNGVEVVIVMDDPNERDSLLDFVKPYPFINWRIICNDREHEWRNPAKALNVGLRHATKRYVMVCSPESEMLTDVIYLLRKTFEDYKSYRHFAIGRVCFADDEKVTEESFNTYHYIPFGSIMAEKEDLFAIHGYDESFCKWGGDDNNLRSRLEMNGVAELYVSDAMMVHRDIDNQKGKERRSEPFAKLPPGTLRHFFYPDAVCANSYVWGQDFDNVIYDWRENKYAREQALSFLSQRFNKFELFCYNNASYPIIALIQVRNDKVGILDCIASLENIVDGIIVLDDGSTDDTYDSIKGHKLLLKASKTHICFDDLENRNLLLRLSTFFSHSLVCFIDTDEYFDPRFSNVRQLVDDDADAYLIPHINLWNDSDTYRTDYPGGFDGITPRYRILRNIGAAQISSNKRLHFPLAHTKGRTKVAHNLLMLHTAYITAADRQRKFNYYIKEDNEHCQSSYDHLAPDCAYHTAPVSSITPSMLMDISSKIISHCHGF